MLAVGFGLLRRFVIYCLIWSFVLSCCVGLNICGWGILVMMMFVGY